MKTLGEFYREHVLSLPKKSLKKRELPVNYGPVTMRQEIFGWKLLSGREQLDCRSQAEARYLRIFWEAGAYDIMVPREDAQIEPFLPELERMKSRMEEIIGDFASTLRSPKLREQLRQEVFAELIQ